MATIKVSKVRNKDEWFVEAYHQNGSYLFDIKSILIHGHKNEFFTFLDVNGDRWTYNDLKTATKYAKDSVRSDLKANGY